MKVDHKTLDAFIEHVRKSGTPRPGDVPIDYKNLTPLGPTAPTYPTEKCVHEYTKFGACKHCGRQYPTLLKVFDPNIRIFN